MARLLIKLMGYEHPEDAVGGGGSRQWQTHTQTVSPGYTGWMEPPAMIGSNLDTCRHGPPTYLINGL